MHGNRNDMKIIKCCPGNKLVIGNTQWQQDLEAKYTFVAESIKAKSLID